jgi:flagellar biosynthesis protein FliQ
VNPVKVFLIVVFFAGLLLCVLAALTATMTLYNIGAVITIAAGVVLLTGTWLNELLDELLKGPHA